MIETAVMPPQAGLMQFFTAKWFAPVIGALAQLRIADQLVDQARSADELATATGADPRSLYRLLRAASSVGVFEEDDEGRFRLTPLAEGLRSDVPGSLRAAAVMFSLEPFWAPYGRIMHSVMTGEPAFDQVYGTSIYQYLEEHPQDAQMFGEAARAFHAQSMGPIAAAHDLSPYGTIVDIGGGNGSLLAEVLHEHPASRGVLLEQASVLPTARAFVEDQGLADRVELVAGDFFESSAARRRVPDQELPAQLLRCPHDRGPSGDPAGDACWGTPPDRRDGDPRGQRTALLEVRRRGDARDRRAAQTVPSRNGGAWCRRQGFRPGRLVPCGGRFSVLEAFAA